MNGIFYAGDSATEIALQQLDKGVKGLLKEDREIANKLSELFESVFTMDDTWQGPSPEPVFSGKAEVDRVDKKGSPGPSKGAQVGVLVYQKPGETS